MKIFISGGCKNGKSTYAQDFAVMQSKNTPLYYVATMQPRDNEDDERIIRHKEERKGLGFLTVEQPTNINGILNICDFSGSFLLDSTTALLANEMFQGNSINHDAGDKICLQLSEVIDKIPNIVIVSDYIYSDAIHYDELTEEYRKQLSQIDKLCAKKCDVVLEAVYSSLIVHKGKEGFTL